MRVLLKIGAGRVLRDVRKFGFDMTSFPRNTQLALGGGTMTVAPVDMVRAYAVLANGGYLVEPYIVDRLVDQQGKRTICHNTCSGMPVLREPTGRSKKRKSRHQRRRTFKGSRDGLAQLNSPRQTFG